MNLHGTLKAGRFFTSLAAVGVGYKEEVGFADSVS
jgi:hypothetical protein